MCFYFLPIFTQFTSPLYYEGATNEHQKACFGFVLHHFIRYWFAVLHLPNSGGQHQALKFLVPILLWSWSLACCCFSSLFIFSLSFSAQILYCIIGQSGVFFGQRVMGIYRNGKLQCSICGVRWVTDKGRNTVHYCRCWLKLSDCKSERVADI